MTHEPAAHDDAVIDLRPPRHWGRHPATRVVFFTALGVGVASRFVHGDAGIALCAGAMAILMLAALVGAVGQMRGNVSPLPGRNWRLVSPIAIFVWTAANLFMSALLLLDLWLTTGERSEWFIRGAVVWIVLMVSGFGVQIVSLSDQWPDRWRPPYARLSQPDAEAATSGPVDQDSSDDQREATP